MTFSALCPTAFKVGRLLVLRVSVIIERWFGHPIHPWTLSYPVRLTKEKNNQAY